MEDKRISKAQSRRLEAEKKARNRRIIFTVVCVVICIGIILLIAHLQNENKDKQGTGDEGTASLTGVIDKSDKYSAGLTADGKIEGIDNINNYVKLGEFELTAYKEDYVEEKNPFGEVKVDADVQIGAHLIDMYVFYSDVQIYSQYYDVMYNLYKFIFNDQYETYKSAYEESNMGDWDSLYDFLGVTEQEYYEVLDEKATADAKYYLVVQALVEKYGITCTWEDKVNYCMSVDSSIVNEAGVNDTVKQFGDAYVTQRTLEWKLKYRLAKEAEILEGFVTDGLSDNSEKFSANYYDNGKIKGIGKLENYITVPDYEQYAGEYADSGELLQKIIDNSEIKIFDDYVYNKVQELQTTTLPDADKGETVTANYELMAEEAFKRDITVQYLISEFKIDMTDYEDVFCREKVLDPDKKTMFVFEYGEGYYNRCLMEYALLTYMDEDVLE